MAQNKDASYESAVACEKRDSKENNHNADNGNVKFSDFGDDDINGGIGSDHDSQQSPPTSPSPPLHESGSPPIPKIILPFNENEKRRRSVSRKVERRRRKDSSDAYDSNADDPMDSPVNYNRQKRHSWWNILVPDNIKHR